MDALQVVLFRLSHWFQIYFKLRFLVLVGQFRVNGGFSKKSFVNESFNGKCPCKLRFLVGKIPCKWRF